MNFWLQSFGACLGGISMFSLAQRYYSLSFLKVVGDLLAFYRAISEPIGHAVNIALLWAASKIGVVFPPVQHELIVLYLLGASAIWRGWVYSRTKSGIRAGWRTLSNWNTPQRQIFRYEAATELKEDLAKYLASTTESQRLDELKNQDDWIGVAIAKTLGTATYYRATILQRTLDNVGRAPIAVLRAVVVTAFWPLFVVFDLTEPLHWQGDFDRAGEWSRQVAMMIFAFAALFALNAAGPSIGL